MRFENWVQPQDVGFIAVGVLIGAIAVVAMQAASEADVRLRAPALWTGPLCPASATDPLQEELARCRSLPREKAGDPACQELWATQRRKFLAPSKTPDGEDTPLDLFSTVPNARTPTAPSSGVPAPKGK